MVDTATISKPIVLSPTLENADGVTEAQVTVSVEGLATKTFTVTNIETVNQPGSYQVDVVTQERVVVIRGSKSVLESLDCLLYTSRWTAPPCLPSRPPRCFRRT